MGNSLTLRTYVYQKLVTFSFRIISNRRAEGMAQQKRERARESKEKKREEILHSPVVGENWIYKNAGLDMNLNLSFVSCT